MTKPFSLALAVLNGIWLCPLHLDRNGEDIIDYSVLKMVQDSRHNWYLLLHWWIYEHEYSARLKHFQCAGSFLMPFVDSGKASQPNVEMMNFCIETDATRCFLIWTCACCFVTSFFFYQWHCYVPCMIIWWPLLDVLLSSWATEHLFFLDRIVVAVL